MRYLFKSTYTPTDPDSDRRRAGVVVLSEAGVLDAITGALSSLELSGLHDDVIREYLEQSGDDDTSEGFEWPVGTNSGEYYFEIKPFEADDPVTGQSLQAWVEQRLTESGYNSPEHVRQYLFGIMSRWTWRTLTWQSESDLRESLFTLITESSDKPYNSMSIEELVATILDQVIDAQSDNYDEITNDRPFGLAAMVEADPELWLGDGAD